MKKWPRRLPEHRPTLNPEEFQPFLLPENPEAVESVKPVEPTEEEIAKKLKLEAEEEAKSIEQAARKNAYEIVETGALGSQRLDRKSKRRC